jgi:hypothetical protein
MSIDCLRRALQKIGGKEAFIVTRIFISHQRQDSQIARTLARNLTERRLEVYLAVIDPVASAVHGPNLGEYVLLQITKCKQFIAVVSQNTQASWWVPWEIGIATARYMPAAIFSKDEVDLPYYLLGWPKLSSVSDLDWYADVSTTEPDNFTALAGEIPPGDTELHPIHKVAQHYERLYLKIKRGTTYKKKIISKKYPKR